MALSRRSSRSESPIWPGFVDAMTSLLMVLMFVLTVFVLVQSVLRETITTQGTELDALAVQVAGLADALGLERNRADALTRLCQLIAKAARRPKRRIATRPTLASQRRRVEGKQRRGETKRRRRGPLGE